MEEWVVLRRKKCENIKWEIQLAIGCLGKGPGNISSNKQTIISIASWGISISWKYYAQSIYFVLLPPGLEISELQNEQGNIVRFSIWRLMSYHPNCILLATWDVFLLESFSLCLLLQASPFFGAALQTCRQRRIWSISITCLAAYRSNFIVTGACKIFYVIGLQDSDVSTIQTKKIIHTKCQ